ncbi:triacylglycerol lipase OBL1-like [Impatiens glandulifera]|uniref:triacylglycerol lipase OBL1-like n=1 Tax=Impatiens glandulifera TaxID=253017 RepID=UPI001FB16A2A|nr:triacylglycerol lipase OBL1-like [Impatiens glandulifera]
MMKDIVIEEEMENKPLVGLESHRRLAVKAKDGLTKDMIHFWMKGDIKKARKDNLIEDHNLKDKYLEDRSAILTSFLAQKAVVVLSRPMKWLGSHADSLLNLTSANHGFSTLLINYAIGKLKKPKKEEQVSVIGHLDSRFELDRNIKLDEPKYFPALCAMASKIAYESPDFIQNVVENSWKMKMVGVGAQAFWNDYHGKNTTHAFMMEDRDRVIVAFRGTQVFDPDTWEMDVDISWFKFKGAGITHMGFMRALGLVETEDGIKGWPTTLQDETNPRAYYAIRDSLKILLVNNNKKFIVTGHSLGGALAVLFTAVLGFHAENELLDRLESVYTFGQPRVGNEKFGMFMEKITMRDDQTSKYIRFVYGSDIVPRLPPWGYSYKHFGTCVYFNSFYEAHIIKGEIEEDYFSIRSRFIGRGIAGWEMVRSILRFNVMNGRDNNKESILMTLIRASFPEAAAHAPSDYVNATRLASNLIFTIKFGLYGLGNNPGFKNIAN